MLPSNNMYSQIAIKTYESFIFKAKNIVLSNVSMFFCITLAVFFLIFPAQSIELVSGITQTAIRHFGLGFIILSSVITLLCIVLAFSPIGKIKLGRPDAKPEFGFFTWIAMLFATGMGSGLVFWGVSEPLSHFSSPPAFVQQSQNTKDVALALTYFHWGLNAWGIYALVGLVMAWFCYNKKRTFQISASFLRNEKQKTINFYKPFDMLAVTAVIFGVAGTLANSIALIETGINQIYPSEGFGMKGRMIILLFIAVIFTLSSASGLHGGIKKLSRLNLILAIGLLAAVIILTSPIDTILSIFSSTATYVQYLPKLAFTIDENSRNWSEGWSVIYLIWWVAWAPFVGPFIGKISKGRTIRQFLLCVLFIPTFASIIWFSAFAGNAFESTYLSNITSAISDNFTNGLFEFFNGLPYAKLLIAIAILLLITFIITSADSAIFITGILTNNTKQYACFAWSIVLVSITSALVYKNNVLLNNQIAIVGAIPFCFVVIMQIIMLIKSLVSTHKQSNMLAK